MERTALGWSVTLADAVENPCVSCADCNLTKSAKMPVDFSGQAEMHF